MKKTTLFAALAWLSQVPLMADTLNKLTISGSYTVVSESTVKESSSGTTTSQKLVSYKISNASILADLVSQSYISSVNGYALYELLDDEASRLGYYAYNAKTGSAVSISGFLSLTLDNFAQAGTVTTASTSSYSKDTSSYKGLASGTLVLGSASIPSYGSYTINPVTSTVKADGVTTVSDAYYRVSYSLLLKGVSSSIAYDLKLTSSVGTHYDGTPTGF